VSTPLEIAEREAEEAEAENPDEETPEPIEPEDSAPEPEPDPEPSAEFNFNEQTKKLAASEKSHRSRVANIMGEDLNEVEVCPLCIGFTAGFVLPYAALSADQGTKDAVRRLNGDAPQAELQAAKDSETCPDCDGWGDVLTGSKAERSRTGPCIKCGGKGYVAKTYLVAAPAPAAQPYPGAEHEVVGAPPGGQPDGYGRPAGHRHWGIDPAVL
jgi:hypothetical protein